MPMTRRSALARLAALAATSALPRRMPAATAPSDPLAGTIAHYLAGLDAGEWTATEITALALERCAAHGAAWRAIDVLDPVETVRAVLPDLQARSDVVVVLSHLGIEEDQALAAAVPGIDIIIGGRSRNLLQEPKIVGSTVITQMGFDGEYLGRLDVTVNEDGSVGDAVVQIVTLTPEIADDPEVADMVLRYKSEYPEPTPVTS